MTTILIIYLFVNTYMTGNLWEEFKMRECNFRMLIGFVLCNLLFIVFAIPIYIFSDAQEFYRWKVKQIGIDTSNVFYVVYKLYYIIKKTITKC
jgi:NADH:ubiquinone oxidoreductase subunit 6 (subunit J)